MAHGAAGEEDPDKALWGQTVEGKASTALKHQPSALLPPHQSLCRDQQLSATHLHTPKYSPITRLWLCASQAVAKPLLTVKSSTSSCQRGWRLLRLRSLPEVGAILECHHHQAVGAHQEQGRQRLKMSRLHTPRYCRKYAHPQLASPL